LTPLVLVAGFRGSGAACEHNDRRAALTAKPCGREWQAPHHGETLAMPTGPLGRTASGLIEAV